MSNTETEKEKSVPGTMKVDFNNARKRAMALYDKLVIELNYAVIKKDGVYGYANGATHDTVDLKRYVIIDSNDIRNTLDDLRNVIGGIGMTFETNREDFKDVFSELYPGEDDHMEIFYDPEMEEEQD